MSRRSEVVGGLVGLGLLVAVAVVAVGDGETDSAVVREAAVLDSQPADNDHPGQADPAQRLTETPQPATTPVPVTDDHAAERHNARLERLADGLRKRVTQLRATDAPDARRAIATMERQIATLEARRTEAPAP